jgi:hypothetical protein
MKKIMYIFYFILIHSNIYSNPIDKEKARDVAVNFMNYTFNKKNEFIVDINNFGYIR